MPASYRREVEYDRKRTSRVNPEAETFVNPAHVTVSGPHFVTGINKPEALEDRACPGCGEPNVDGVCVFCFDDTEPSVISLPDHSDWY